MTVNSMGINPGTFQIYVLIRDAETNAPIIDGDPRDLHPEFRKLMTEAEYRKAIQEYDNGNP